uniref:EGF-like domain-containing protein n=1 Tax=Rhodnius prolixus TaxID=13249 RepID=T1HJW5_RHOPR
MAMVPGKQMSGDSVPSGQPWHFYRVPGAQMFVIISTAYGDDEICEKTWTSNKTVRQSYIHSVSKYLGYCNSEICQKTQLQSRIEYRVKYEEFSHTLKYCCDGYEKVSAEPLACHPSCSPNCILGNCTGPGICTCIEGHKQRSSYECEPICDPPCVNAKCTYHNKCDCSENYKKDGTTNHICNPVCDEECQNGQCIRPQECQCFDGYKLSDQNKYYCLPHCGNCMNGICTKPKICECNDGYTKVNETCAPYCSRECIHGKCSQPEKCTCNDGYTSHAEDWNQCVPYCSEPCINSLCSEPGVCTCLQNYTKVNGSICEPVCNTPCKIGVCTAPDTCVCNASYKPITEYICEPDCTFKCEYLYIVPAVLLITGAILLIGIIYTIRKHSSSYREQDCTNALQAQKVNKKRELAKEIDVYRLTEQQKHKSREFDLNDPKKRFEEIHSPIESTNGSFLKFPSEDCDGEKAKAFNKQLGQFHAKEENENIINKNITHLDSDKDFMKEEKIEIEALGHDRFKRSQTAKSIMEYNLNKADCEREKRRLQKQQDIENEQARFKKFGIFGSFFETIINSNVFAKVFTEGVN